MLKRHVEILSEKLQDFTSAWNQPIKKNKQIFKCPIFSKIHKAYKEIGKYNQFIGTQ